MNINNTISCPSGNVRTHIEKAIDWMSIIVVLLVISVNPRVSAEPNRQYCTLNLSFCSTSNIIQPIANEVIGTANNMTMTILARCRYQSDVDKQIRILHTINSALPKSLRLQMPSLLTNDYVSRALDIIEDRILPHIGTPANTILAPHYKK